MSCYSGPGVTHYAGCDCWNESIRAQAYADGADKTAKRLRFAEERRAALFVKAECDRRAAAGELKKLRAEVSKAYAEGERAGLEKAAKYIEASIPRQSERERLVTAIHALVKP